MSMSELHIDANKPICHLKSNSDSGKELLAVGSSDSFVQDLGNLSEFQRWLDKDPSWVFGILGYDLKNSVEKLQSENTTLCKSPQIAFFKPCEVWQKQNDLWSCLTDPSQPKRSHLQFSRFRNNAQIKLKPQISKEIYLNAVDRVKHHIQIGDVYELNYCHAFHGKYDDLDMRAVFEKLNTLTTAPFGGFFSLEGHQLACGSPERFMRRHGNELISQPIKGTIKRGESREEDLALMKKLANSPKDRSENVMITDLVRNDLSRIAQRASVRVDELFGIHSFQTVHQMISTVSCEVKPEASFTDILRATFPMGSMTGAPKVRAMQLIEDLESFQRGWYSGSLGYIEPDGDFDFNVIIRSVMHNQHTGQVQACAGGAIVIDSSPEDEYDESILKLNAVLQSLT